MSAKRKAESHSRGTSRPHIMKSGGCQVDSERDSGFSDASSEHMSTMDTTDSEDSPRPLVQHGAQASASGPQPSQLAVVGGSYSNLSPMIIMNNVLLKQPGDNPPALKPWGFSPAVEMVQPVVQQPQVVFLQPVVSQQASPASKEGSSRHRRTKNYLPILKSYPKIAPHPGDGSSSSGRGTASSSSSSSSSMSSITSSGSERGASSQRELCPKDKRHRKKSGGASNLSSAPPSVPASPGATSPLLLSQLSVWPTERSASSSPIQERPSPTTSEPEPRVSHSSASKSETVALSEPTTPGDVSPQPPSLGDSDSDTKRKRFCNTYNILSKSGLLDIALRTKELNRLNRRTQTDLDRLKEQTDLFLQALLNGDSSVCVNLQAHLGQEESGEERAAQDSLKAD